MATTVTAATVASAIRRYIQLSVTAIIDGVVVVEPIEVRADGSDCRDGIHSPK